MKTYTKDCIRCGVVFEAKHHNTKLCSEECKKERNYEMIKAWKADNKETVREYSRDHYQRHLEEQRERSRQKSRKARANMTQEERDELNADRRATRAAWNGEMSRQAADLKPVLDSIDFTPENLIRISLMVDYLESEPRLAFLLDWYWLSDAKEYLDEQR